ncbi:hypothetical protein [Chryseobacterium wanjuense]
MKKIYYFPGLISALLIPVLFWCYINPHVDKTVYNVMDFGLPMKLAKDKSNFDLTIEPLRKWNFKKNKNQFRESRRKFEIICFRNSAASTKKRKK